MNQAEAGRPSVLVLVPHYLPGYKSGGPIRSIANLVDHLGDDFRFLVVTSDRDATDSQAYPGIRPNTWNEVGKAAVFYASPSLLRGTSVLGLIKETPTDLIYLNSFFHPSFTLPVLLAKRFGVLGDRKVVLAPRGEFSPGALGLKRWKKRPVLAAFRLLGVERDLVWQVSSEHELRDVLNTFPTLKRERIRVAPDLAQTSLNREPGKSRDVGQGNGTLRILFLSRITRMKNLDTAIRIVSRVSICTEFNIYGPVRDNAYWSECQALMQAAPSHVRITYHGPVPQDRVHDLMAAHDLYVLPTRGENYGHVIAEALSAGTPVLISDRTPWRDLESAGVGWDLPLENEEGFTRAIEQFVRMGSEEYLAMRKAARSWAQDRLTDPEVIESNRALFLDAIASRI